MQLCPARCEVDMLFHKNYLVFESIGDRGPLGHCLGGFGILLLRGTIGNRTYGMHKNLYI